MLNVVIVLFLIVTVLMIIAVLLQSSKNDGIGAGFGALGGTQVFGGRGANDVLRKLTSWLAIFFFAFTLILSYLYRGNTAASSSNPILDDAKANSQPVETVPAADFSLPTVEDNSQKTDSTKK